MSQVFSADAQQLLVNKPNAGAGPDVVLSTNPLQPPFETAKATVIAIGTFLVPTGCTRIDLEIVRNPDSENLTVESSAMDVVAGKLVACAVGVIDPIPDSRAVVYALQIEWEHASANDGLTVDGTFIQAMLLSG